MNILSGISQLLQSPSGVFSLLSLVAISLVTWHAPAIGAGAFVAFFSIVPTALGIFEHREQMAQIAQQTNVTINNLPPKGNP